MSWGISENASEKEKLKAEVNDYFHGLNAVGKIDYIAYSELYDVCLFLKNVMIGWKKNA